MGADFVDFGAFYFHQHRFVLIHAALGDDFAARIAGKALSPKFQSLAAGRRFMPHAVNCGNITAVGNGVAALDGLPGSVLGLAFDDFFSGMPADGGWVKNELGPGQCCEPSGLREPLIPADQHANAAVRGVPRAEALIAGGEVKLLVVQRIIRDMHFPVGTK